MKTPISFAKPHVTDWIVQESQLTGRKGTLCELAASAAYDWSYMRAGQLNPEDEELAKKNCQEYVKDVVTAQVSGMGPLMGLVLLWCLQAIVIFVVTRLLTWIFTDNGANLKGWQQFVAAQQAPTKG